MELKLPELGENISQGTVTKVLVKAGDSIKKGQNVLELETDKAVLEVPSSADGVISEVLVKTGAVVKVGQTVFKLNGSAAAQPGKSSHPEPTGEGSKKDSSIRSMASVPNDSKTTAASAYARVSGGVMDMILPALGENIEKGTVTKILVKAGDSIKKGQNILELETDKAVLEVPSPLDGIIKDILVKAGAIIKVGQPVFKIQAAGETPTQPVSPNTAAPEKPNIIVGETKQSPKEKEMASSPSAPRKDSSAATAIPPVRKDIPAAPSVRLLARELGIDIAQVPGSGPGGRISNNDVKAYCKTLNTSRPAGSGAGVSTQPLPDFSKWGPVRREAMSNVRRKTAEHLSHAWQVIPHVTQFDKVDITELEKLRKSVAGTGKKLSVTPFIIKVVAAALKKFPQFNASVDMATNEIVYKDYVNIGVAVDTDRGLLVPVLKNVDHMSILQISDELTAAAERARLRKTSLEEMSGGCFTISNLGGIGGTMFTPVVNWPEVAILGVSRGAMEQVYTDGIFMPRFMLPMSLSYDHRQVDGADGARFIRWVCEAIQQPFLLDLNK